MIKHLIANGHTVRGTVRDAAKDGESAIRALTGAAAAELRGGRRRGLTVVVVTDSRRLYAGF